jgi:hypothetical protein
LFIALQTHVAMRSISTAANPHTFSHFLRILQTLSVFFPKNAKSKGGYCGPAVAFCCSRVSKAVFLFYGCNISLEKGNSSCAPFLFWSST